MSTGSYASYVITGSYAAGPFTYASGAYALTGSYIGTGTTTPTPINTGIGTSAMVAEPANASDAPVLSKRIKIPWKMYKFTDIKNNRKKSIRNGTTIAEAICAWWRTHFMEETGGVSIKELNGVYINHLNIVADSIPVEFNGQLIEKLGILPIATFKSNTAAQIEDNDFVFNGTMKVSKLDPEELVTVQIDGIEVVAGRYEMKVKD